MEIMGGAAFEACFVALFLLHTEHDHSANDQHHNKNNNQYDDDNDPRLWTYRANKNGYNKCIRGCARV